MPTPRQPPSDRLLDLFLQVCLAVGRVIPEGLLLAGLRALVWVAVRVLPTRRQRAERRVAETLGHAPGSPASRRIVRGAFETLALNLVETSLVNRRLRRGESLEDFIAVEGREHLERILARGPDGERPGALICTGHIGAWELLGPVVARLSEPLWVVARPPNSPRLRAWALQRRMAWSLGSIDKEGSSLPLARAMRAGQPVGVLLDQNAGRSGWTEDFLGLPASHHRVAGVMGRRFGAVSLPVYLLREPGRLRFRLVIEPPVHVDPTLPTDEAQERDVVRRLSRSLEARVRAAPEQWMWLHDRWRHALRRQRLAARAAASLPAGVALPVEEGTTGR